MYAHLWQNALLTHSEGGGPQIVRHSSGARGPKKLVNCGTIPIHTDYGVFSRFLSNYILLLVVFPFCTSNCVHTVFCLFHTIGSCEMLFACLFRVAFVSVYRNNGELVGCKLMSSWQQKRTPKIETELAWENLFRTIYDALKATDII